MKKALQTIGVILAIGFGFALTAQSPSMPEIQGFYPTGKKIIPVQVDANGVVQVSGVGGGGCTAPCAVVGTAAAGSPPSGDPVQVAGSDGTNIRTLNTDTAGKLNVNITPSGTQNVVLLGTGTLISGQQAVTGTAAALATHAANSVCVKAALANTINVYVGPTGVTTSTGLELAPGAGYCAPLNNSNLIFVVASTTGASVTWAITD